jgi:hypothetical protein
MTMRTPLIVAAAALSLPAGTAFVAIPALAGQEEIGDTLPATAGPILVPTARLAQADTGSEAYPGLTYTAPRATADAGHRAGGIDEFPSSKIGPYMPVSATATVAGDARSAIR